MQVGTYRYRKERRFPLPPEAIWPLVADSARLNELAGFPGYQVEERLDGDGRVRRIASARVGPIPLKWEESFGEWQEHRHVSQRRDFLFGPIRRFKATCDLIPEGTETRLVFAAEIDCVGLMGLMAKTVGLLTREGDKRLAAIERMIGQSGLRDQIPGASETSLIKSGARRRFDALARDLAGDPGSHGLTPRLTHFLAHAPSVSLRGIRALTLARVWNTRPAAVVELFLAAQRCGLVAMGWDLLCPRCRGAKARVAQLHELPTGAHCSSCNIDYERDFRRNVELTFHP